VGWGRGWGRGRDGGFPASAGNRHAAMLATPQPQHPALQASSPAKAPLPRGALRALAAPQAGSGTLGPWLGRVRRNPSAGACGRAAGWPSGGCTGASSPCGESRAGFVRQCSVSGAVGYFHRSLRAWLPFFFVFLVAKRPWFLSGLDSPCAASVGNGQGRESQYFPAVLTTILFLPATAATAASSCGSTRHL